MQLTPASPVAQASTRERAAEFWLWLGFLLIGFAGLLLGFGAAGHVLGLPLARWQSIAAVLLVTLLPLGLPNKWFALPLRARLRAVLVFAGILTASLAVAISFSDITCDGQAYHGIAIMQLLDRWNPIYEPDRAENAEPPAIFNQAKGSWIIAAQLCLLAGDAEAGKALHLLLIAAAFSLTFHAALHLSSLSTSNAAMLAALVAFNPVSLNQALSYYVDGQLASLFTALLIATGLLVRQARGLHAALVVLILALLVNVKVTALVYAIVFGGVAGACLLLTRQWREMRRFTLVYSGGLLLAALLGFNPYVTNWWNWGTPFYPYGAHGSDAQFAAHLVPASVRHRNRIDALWRSIAGRCDNSFDLASHSFTGAPLKLPFTFHGDELASFRDVDTRICGWGPLFSGILLVAIAGAFLSFRKISGRWASAAAVAIGATILALPYPWNARYAPQLWLMPALVLAALWLTGGRRSQGLGSVLATLMLANLLLVAIPSVGATWTKTRLLRRQLQMLAAQPEPVVVVFGEYQFNRLRFEEAGIRYRSLSALPSDRPSYMLAGEVLHLCYTAIVPPP